MFGFVKRWLVRREVKRLLEELGKGGHLNFLKAFFGGSKKATAVLLALLACVLKDVLGLSPETIAEIVKLIMTYIGGQGIVDAALAFRGLKNK